MQTNEVVVDVRGVVPRERHPKIFNTWEALEEEAAMLLVNDHDPVPLYYQFAAQNPGRFRWEYLEMGPENWRVRIHKGDFADPGFVPGSKAIFGSLRVAGEKVEPLVLDVRPIFAAGGSPCSTIDNAVATLKPGQAFVLLAPFEPVPLFAKLGAKGLTPKSELQLDGSYRITFTPGGKVVSGEAAHVGCDCSGH